MKILFTSSEAVPYCKTGGLADVAGALPEQLAQGGNSLCLVLPLYRAIDRQKHKLQKTNHRFLVPLGDVHLAAEVWQAPDKKNLKTFFLACDILFDRAGLYGPVSGTDHPDNDRRFSFFSRAILEFTKAIKFKPDIIHTHDWQTGLVSALLKTTYRADPFFNRTASFFTIHNMAYQGHFDAHSFDVTGLPPSEFGIGGVEFYGKVNFLKAGVAYADALSTVSPTYAKEIMSRYEYGFGLEGLLSFRRDRLRGIINGLDMAAWNPKTDPFIKSHFDVSTISRRAMCKSDLQRKSKLPVNKNIPILGFVGRLDRQKGVAFLLEIAPRILSRDVQMVFLGVGDRVLQEGLQQLQKQYRSKVFLETAFSELFAHQIYAGSDMFLMPSLYEPCGLGQMIAMRYGAIPVVTPTGGLLDTVKPYQLKNKGTGFVARELSAFAVYEAIQEGISEFKRQATWIQTQKRMMKVDFSWTTSIPAYLEHYERACAWQKKSR